MCPSTWARLRGYCPHCKTRVESRHPDQPPAADLPHAQLGLNALAIAAALKHDAGLPYRKVPRAMAVATGGFATG